MKANLRQFDYQKVARADAAMWRAYYNHQFFKLFWQLLKLSRSQLGLNWWLTARTAYYSGWAAADYRLRKGRENYPRTLKNLVKFYKVISDNATEPFDYQKVADLELEWWDIHRYPNKYQKSLEQSLADGMAAIYSVPADKFKLYAEGRATAMHLPRHEGDKQAEPVDWQHIDNLLLAGWKAAHTAVQR